MGDRAADIKASRKEKDNICGFVLECSLRDIKYIYRSLKYKTTFVRLGTIKLSITPCIWKVELEKLFLIVIKYFV